MKRLRLPLLLLLAAGALLLGGALTPVVLRGDGAARGTGTAATGVVGGSVPARIAAAQRRLREVPGDWRTWAGLGVAYVEQSRLTADPSWYAKAEGALRRSLDLEPERNWEAMAGMGALANARHDFPAALHWGRRAEAVNPAAGAVHAVLVDALTQLGDHVGARAATGRMLSVAPGVASFTRAAYDLEQHGEVAAARAALHRALAEATDPADRAFCHHLLGELAFDQGDPVGALADYDAGLRADPGQRVLRAGRARALAALGETGPALDEYARVVRALPLPHVVAGYADTLAASGQVDAARRQYELYDAQQRMLAANGGTDPLADAVFRADHGDPAGALAAAQTEWARREHVLVADALAWALHRSGRSAEALPLAVRATSLGWRNATFHYHRGAIRHALGDRDGARRDLTTALAVNPYFDILQAPQARQLLASLGGPL